MPSGHRRLAARAHARSACARRFDARPPRCRPCAVICRRPCSVRGRSPSRPARDRPYRAPQWLGQEPRIDCLSAFQKLDGGHSCWRRRQHWPPAHHIARAGLMRTFQTVRVYERLCLLDIPPSPTSVRSGDLVTSCSHQGLPAFGRDASEPSPAAGRVLSAFIALRCRSRILSYGQKSCALAPR